MFLRLQGTLINFQILWWKTSKLALLVVPISWSRSTSRKFYPNKRSKRISIVLNESWWTQRITILNKSMLWSRNSQSRTLTPVTISLTQLRLTWCLLTRLDHLATWLDTSDLRRRREFSSTLEDWSSSTMVRCRLPLLKLEWVSETRSHQDKVS
jgi:hypothetical protein